LHNRAESAATHVTRGSRTLGARRLVRVDGCSGSCPPPPPRGVQTTVRACYERGAGALLKWPGEVERAVM